MVSAMHSMRLAMEQEEQPYTLDARYTLGDVLGEGGYAVVKGGTRIADGAEVAVKIMLRDAIDADTEASIRNEVSMLQSLAHPNIVRAHELFEEGGHFYFVLEKVSGGELFDRIVAKTYYNEKEARGLAQVLLGALQYMHSHGIAHRDLKPEVRRGGI
ncbi:kinase-like domain-containing protein [Ochromonadaceae sp. CCMP2298]|nr:kinase-like domain-containing protein [Ochromonadaceae sp. CCMP2298]